MRSTLLLFGLASALSLGIGGTALAQRGHGGGHFGGGHVGGGHAIGGAHLGGGHVGGGWAGGSHVGGVAGHGAWGHAGRYGYGYGGWGYGRGYRYGPSVGFTYGYPYGAYYGYPSGTGLYLGVPLADDENDYYPQVPAYDYGALPSYGESLPADPNPAPTVTSQPVTLTVLLPTPDAELSLNGTATTLQGIERKFQSPPLTPGQNYSYRVTAKWTENGQLVEQTQDVPVTAGQAVTVDFRGSAR